MEGIIYCYTSPSGKHYVGQTRDEAKRRACFMNPNRGYAGYLINRARAHYGPSSFSYKVLERIQADSLDVLASRLNERESYWVGEMHSCGPGGYNLSSGGDVQDSFVLFKRSICAYDEDGTFIGEFTNRAELQKVLGCPGDYAMRCARGDILSTNGIIFLYSDDRDQLQLRLDMISNRQPNEAQTVYVYSADAELLHTYPSLTLAAESVNCSLSVLCQMCSGTCYCKDVLFSYTQDEDSIMLRLSRLGWSQKPHVVDVVMPDGELRTFRSEKHASEELGLPISLVMRGCTGSVPVIMGYQFTPRATPFKLYSSSRPVLQCDSAGNVIGQFMSVKDACLQTGFSRIDISGSLGGHRPKVHGTFFVYGDFWDGVSKFEVPWTDKPAILCYQKDGVLVGRYSSIKEAATTLGLRESCINFAVWGKRSQTGGYVFLRECDMNELDARLARANATRSRDPRSRRVEVFAPDGTSLGVFDSGAEVRKIPELKHAHVTALCQGKEKHHKGYTMRYA